MFWQMRVSDEERERLERLRRGRGLRSAAELVRVLLVEEERRQEREREGVQR